MNLRLSTIDLRSEFWAKEILFKLNINKKTISLFIICQDAVINQTT